MICRGNRKQNQRLFRLKNSGVDIGERQGVSPP